MWRMRGSVNVENRDVLFRWITATGSASKMAFIKGTITLTAVACLAASSDSSKGVVGEKVQKINVVNSRSRFLILAVFLVVYGFSTSLGLAGAIMVLEPLLVLVGHLSCFVL